MNGRQFTAEFHKLQLILTIPEENALAQCITQLTIVEHAPKRTFIHKLVVVQPE